MNDGDKLKFLEVLTGLAEIYEMEVTEVLLEMWFQVLKDYDIKEISAAATKYIGNPDNGMFKPKPAALVKILKGTSQDISFIAWTKLDKAIRMIGDYQTVCFDDPIIHRVVEDMGGWCGFGDISEDEWPFRAKEFQQRYRGYSQRGEIPEHPKQLTGQSDHDNKKHGFSERQEVIFIGDKEKALLIQGGLSLCLPDEARR